METNNKQNILMKNNVLIKTKYNLKPNENKVLQLILFKFQQDKNKVIEDIDEGTFKLKIEKKDIKNLIKEKNKATVNGMSEILIKLRQTEIYFYNKAKKAKGVYGFINGFTYYEIEGVFEIEISKKIYNLVINYLKGYTPVNMIIFFSLKTYSSQRIYELLRLWSNTKSIINYSLSDLKELLKLENSYPLYKDFKKRILKPSIEELNKKSLMTIDIKENKVNRKVVSIDFIVEDNDKRIYFKDEKKKEVLVPSSGGKGKNKQNPVDKLKFNNFTPRDYDYDVLEKKLLGWENA